MELNCFEIKKKIINFIQNKVKTTSSRGVVIGISGGIDSSVVATLCANAIDKKNIIGLILPCESKKEDIDHGILLAETIGIDYKIIDLNEAFRSLVDAADLSIIKNKKTIVFGNIKSRLRMTTLYFESALRSYLVAGTTNKSEWITGYFTKYGDGAADFEPIRELLKREIFILGRYLGLPRVLLERVPSAGLVGIKTDEEEFGFTYDALDTYIEKGQGNSCVIKKINRLYKLNKHKRNMPSVLNLERHFFLK